MPLHQHDTGNEGLIFAALKCICKTEEYVYRMIKSSNTK